jgi:hypothetical protein
MPVCLNVDGHGEVDRHINRKLEPPSPWAPTVDHIIPRALGGTDAKANLRAAHAKCNNDAAHGGNWSTRNVSPPVLQDPEAVLGGPGFWQQGVRQERDRQDRVRERRAKGRVFKDAGELRQAWAKDRAS